MTRRPQKGASPRPKPDEPAKRDRQGGIPIPRASSLLLCTLLLLAPSCEPTTSPKTGDTTPPPVAAPAWRVWAVSDMVALTDRTPRTQDLGAFAQETIRFAAAANETVSVQLVIDAPPQGLRDVRLATDGLAGPNGAAVPADRLTFARMLPVQVRRFPSWFLRMSEAGPVSTRVYEALAPLPTGRAGQLQPNGRLAVWIDLAVPRSARPGVYKGTIRLSARGEEAKTIPVELTVWDLILPDTHTMPALGAFSHRSVFAQLVRRDGQPYVPDVLDTKRPLVREGLAAVDAMMKTAHDHRLDLFDVDLVPQLQRDFQGDLHLDWTDYDAVAKPYLTGSAFANRIGVAAWPVPLSVQWPDPENYGGAKSEFYKKTIGAVLRDALAHLQKISDQPTYFLRPQPASPARDGTFVSLIHSLQPDLLIPQLVNGRTLAARSQDSRGTATNPLADGPWLTPGPPPYLPDLSVLARPADVRVLPWIAMKYGCAAVFIPDVLAWPGTPDDPSRLFYPGPLFGRQGILPSIRLKRLRRGLQDVSYLWILRRRGRSVEADRILGAMARYAGLDAVDENPLDPRLDGWVTSPAAWTHVRALMAAEVIEAIHPGRDTPAGRTARDVRWARLADLTGRFLVEQVESRIAVADDKSAAATQPTRQSLDVTLRVTVVNPQTQPASLRLTVGPLPPGWKRIDTPRDVSVAGRTRQTLEARLTGPPPRNVPSGKMPVELTIRTPGAPPTDVLAEIPFLQAAFAATPPVIDGKLDDWPIRPGASAGDFRLLGRRGLGPADRPRRGTTAFVLQDDKHLYVAFRCEEPNLAGMVVRPDNQLHYDQLLADAEDSVELLVDPGGKARGAEDLYHLAVKPSGVVIQELGVRTEPMLGPSRPLNTGVRSAVAKRNGVWTVEMRIPRSAFGSDGASPLWRINFARFAAQGAEPSSWSRARRNFYDPDEMGTLFVPRP